MLDSILNAIKTALLGDAQLPEPIYTVYLVEGMVPGVDTTASVWVPKQKFKEYDVDQDEVSAEIHIGIGVQDADAENGEMRVRDLAEEIRLLLTADQRTLGGLLDNSFLSDWQFATADVSQTETLHLGEAVWEVTYYAPRYRPVTPATQMDELAFDESIDTDS